MLRREYRKDSRLVVEEGATALLTATFAFLLRNKISKKIIVDLAKKLNTNAPRPRLNRYTKLVREYEEMGLVMSTWFSLPRFLDNESRPLPLKENRGYRSIAALASAARVSISAKGVINLLRRSSSVRIDASGNFIAVKRMFVLPDFEVLRAALVVDRYLGTLRRNSSAHRTGTTLLLERNCHVGKIELQRMSPILRDIKGRGTAFMDSVDGDIEAQRVRTAHRRKGVGELGVLVFAWTRSSKTQHKKSGAKTAKH